MLKGIFDKRGSLIRTSQILLKKNPGKLRILQFSENLRVGVGCDGVARDKNVKDKGRHSRVREHTCCSRFLTEKSDCQIHHSTSISNKKD